MVVRAVGLGALLFGAAWAGLACGPSDRVGVDVPTRTDANQAAGGGAGNAADGAGSSAPAADAGSAGAYDSSAAGDASVDAGDAGSDNAGSGAAGAGGAAGTGGVTAAAGGGGVSGSPGAAGSAGTAAVGGAGGSLGAAGAGGAQDAECDMTGIWIARLTTFSRDSIFSSTQTASNWFYYEFAQTGRTIRVSKAIDCGIQVSGSADVTINDATTKALLHPNDQTGRKGEFYRDGDHCVFKLDRFYSTRGIPRAKYLPPSTSSNPELSTIMPMLPTEMMPQGAEDWDGDGNPGIAFNVSGLGSRHVVQRDWNQFASDDTYTVALNSSMFVAAATFDNQEQILAVSGGLGGLLKAGSTPALDLHHRITLQMLGRSASDPAVGKVRLPDDLETCYKVQEALPHDKAMQ